VYDAAPVPLSCGKPAFAASGGDQPPGPPRIVRRQKGGGFRALQCPSDEHTAFVQNAGSTSRWVERGDDRTFTIGEGVSPGNAMKFPHDDLLPDLSALRSVRAAFARRQRWVIGSTLVIAAATAGAYAIAPRHYVANGSVWLDNSMAAA
jgi:hypothetical protein